MATITSSKRYLDNTIELKGHQLHWSHLLNKVGPHEEMELRLSNKEYIVVDTVSICLFTESIDQHAKGLNEMGLNVYKHKDHISINISIEQSNVDTLKECGQLFEDNDDIIASLYTVKYYKTKTMSGKG